MAPIKKTKKISVNQEHHSQKIPLAVGYHKQEVFLLEKIIHGKMEPREYELVIVRGHGESVFTAKPEHVHLVRIGARGKKIPENLAHCRDFKFFCHDDDVTLSYVRQGTHGPEFAYASTEDFITWVVGGTVKEVKKAGILIPEIEDGASDIIYSSGDQIETAISQNLESWKVVFPARAPHWNFFEGFPFSIIGVIILPETIAGGGIAVFYESRIKSDIFIDERLHNKKIGEEHFVKIGAAIFSSQNPTKLLWQTELPLMEISVESDGHISFIGVMPIQPEHNPKARSKKEYTMHGARFYFADKSGKIHLFELPLEHLADHKSGRRLKASRAAENPIMKPSEKGWEYDGVFNPAAVRLDRKVHLLYRAVGTDGWSRIGHAATIDGVHISERGIVPIYSLHKHEIPDLADGEDMSLFSSGGSWGGCEDPKATAIDGRIYMTFVAHDGGWPMRTALTSISQTDFKNKKWRWVKPQLMSAPNVGSKSVVILPEKITNKNGAENYVVFHRVWPNIMVDVVPKLEFGEGKRWLQNLHSIRPRRSYWDSQKLSMGTAPIRTPHGWLAIYSAVDRRDSSKYKIGAMLLDLNEPWKVIARSRRPILEPDEHYENTYEGGRGKAGIVYPGGAVDIDGVLHIYYGGADMVTCVATVPMNEIVANLLRDRQPNIKITQCLL